VQSVQDNLYANPAHKSVSYPANYHVTFIFWPSHESWWIMFLFVEG
jgi:glucan phosphoethanolaminetransferase (alkaline phosphatase superfamily)